MLVRIEAPYFVAGLIVTDNTVTETAPILRKALLGKSRDQARTIIKSKGWKATEIKPKAVR